MPLTLHLPSRELVTLGPGQSVALRGVKEFELGLGVCEARAE